MPKPLRSIMQKTIVTGTLKPIYDLEHFDSKGNPIRTSATGKLQLTLKVVGDQPKYRSTYGVIGDRLVVECHLLKSWIKVGDNFQTAKLKPDDFMGTLKNDKITLTIIDMAQYNLLPLRKIFSLKFLALQDGHLT